MFKNKKEIFSIRKFKDGRSDSVKIGAIALLLGTALMTNTYTNVSATETNTNSPGTEVRNTSDTVPTVDNVDKVPSDKSVTFIDDNNDNKFKVDAVLGKGVTEPTKANSNIGEKDGTNTLNVKSETNVNYLLEEDNSKLKDSVKLETGTGTISTDYDKKGLSFDTDGKDYRKSTVNKDNISVTEETGKEDVIKTNGKAYKLKRSEVLNKDKLKYDKTTFNDIEANVSPEGLHTDLGEIDYTKLNGKIYLVEETSDGKYGKFVEANNVTNDEEAVKSWKEGQANAKEFTKENVTLEEGDSILVMDKDTYAVAAGTKVKNRRIYGENTYTSVHETETNEVNFDLNITYEGVARTFADGGAHDVVLHTAGPDNIFGTDDDVQDVVERNVKGYSLYLYGYNSAPIHDDLKGYLNINPNIDNTKASLSDLLKNIKWDKYKTIDYLLSKNNINEENKEKLNSKKTELDNKFNEILNYIKTEDIKMVLEGSGLRFYTKDSAKMNGLNSKLQEVDELFNDFKVKENPTVSDSSYNGESGFTKTETTSYIFEGTNLKRETVTNYDKEGHPTRNEYDVRDEVETEEISLDKLKDSSFRDFTVTEIIEKDGKKIRKSTNDYTYSEEFEEGSVKEEISFTEKEIITPIRAYKVMPDGLSTVNHYYDLKLEPEELKETIETKGKAVVKFVDSEGNEIKPDENIVPETIIKTVKKYETKSDVTVISTREEVENNDTTYNASSVKEDIIMKDGKKYKLNKVLEPSDKYNNTVSENGNLTEGTTTIVYQYDLIIPVDPTKPNEGQTNPPMPDDKIPNDPLNRSYKDLGLAKEVKRDITYVYENGPKAGKEASAPVNQKARFTRTAEINARTGEVTYLTEWTESQNLNEVISPVKDKYNVDKEKVETLAVTHESEDSSVIVKYTENPDIIEHDESKDKKGTVIVKLIDDKGEILKEETIKDNVIVATATTKVYADRDPETTYTPTNEEYSTTEKKVPVFEKDGKKYKLNKLVEVSPELNNSTDETGKVKEGTTTIVYQYDLIVPAEPIKPHENQTNPPTPGDKIPNDPQNRSYKDLGLAKEVKRDITYVYENGPKAGQEVSAPVNQKARFTRTGEINRRTGEITYLTEWTPEQNLNEVISPVKDKYNVDKEKVETLAVTHESEDSSVVVKYTENPEIIEHDEAKDKKGTVIVKLVDSNGDLLTEETVKDNVTVATATTKVYADRNPETTYTQTNEEYSTVDKKVDTFEKNGKKYKFNKVLEVSDTLGNSIEESGKVKEGTTTIVYQYDLIIPVDPTKPNEGQTNPPMPDDKIPNDPQNRSYKDLGLLKEVTRNITYVYENGPKKGEQASEPVNQKARFTRTAEINARTGEVTYTADWPGVKSLEEVNSPKVEGYLVDKNKVESLNVTHESEDSSVVVKYKESVTVIDHDVDKDKKGTVIVKLVDVNGTVLKETTVKNNVIVATATTKVYADRDPETTYTPTNEEYSIEREETITIDRLTFKLNRLIPVSNELNNSIDESGKVKEGTTRIIYEYKLIIPSNDIVNEKPEFNASVNPIDPPVVEIPEFEGGVNPIEPPVVDIPEYNGGVAPLDPPVVEIPEFNGGVTPIEPPVVEVPEYNGDLTHPKPPVVETPKEEPAKPTENKPVEPKQEKVLPNTNSTSILTTLVSSVIGTLGLGYKSKRKK